MRSRRRSSIVTVIATCVAVASSAGCLASSQRAVAEPGVASRAVRPDLHGEPLLLLPPGALAWARVDAQQVRRSPYFDEALALADRSLAQELRTLERELGVDLVRESDVFAVAMYARPGVRGHGWPALVVRGRIDAQRVLGSAAARAAPDDPLTERVVDGARVHATRARTYYFAAPDVLFLFDTALTGRVLEQLAGANPNGLTADPRFSDLWAQSGGVDGPVRIAVDTVGLRDAAGIEVEAPGAVAGRVRRLVARARVDDAVELHVTGATDTPAAAAAIVDEIDALRRTLLRRVDVRLFGFARLLQQGLTAVSEGPVVRVGIYARDEEVRRLLRAGAIIESILGGG